MDLVQNQQRFGKAAVEYLGILQPELRGGKVAVDEFCLLQTSGEGCFSNPSHAREPNDGDFRSVRVDARKPDSPSDHEIRFYV